jgi:hypothetical protein
VVAVTATKRVTAVDVRRTTGGVCGFDIITLYLCAIINNMILYSGRWCCARVSHYELLFQYNVLYGLSRVGGRAYEILYIIIPNRVGGGTGVRGDYKGHFTRAPRQKHPRGEG